MKRKTNLLHYQNQFDIWAIYFLIPIEDFVQKTVSRKHQHILDVKTWYYLNGHRKKLRRLFIDLVLKKRKTTIEQFGEIVSILGNYDQCLSKTRKK